MKVFITGASSGIGRALALRLAQDGHTLGLAARRHDRLEAVATEVEQAGGQAQIYPLDVCDRQAQVTAMTDFAHTGAIDAVVACAGFGITKPVLQTTSEDAEELFAVNFFGLLYTLQAAAPHLKGGTFVGVSSVVTYAMPTGYGVYSASKAAVNTLLTTARRELAKDFQVVIVNPGETETEFWQVAAEHSGTLIPGQSPVPFVKPEKVAEAIVQSIVAPKPEVFISFTERFLPMLRGAFPGVLEQYFKLATKA